MAKKIKIGFLDTASKESGGIYQYSKSIFDSLNNNNNDYELFKFSYKKDGKDSRLLKTTAGLTKYFYFIILFIRASFKLLPRDFEDIDLFISPYSALAPHIFLRKKFIFTLHDLQEKYYPENFSFKERLLRQIRNYVLLKQCMFVICESESVKNDIEKFFKIHQSKIVVMPSPPPKSIYNQENKFDQLLLNKEYGLSRDYIFYPAQFWPHKNHIGLLKALDILKNKHPNLLTVFTGDKRFEYDKVKEISDKFNLTDNVMFVGNVPYSHLPVFYKNSICLVMPTLFESISIPIYEAFYFSTPVVCSNICGLPEQCGEAATFFDPNNPNDIADKISAILLNKKRRKSQIEEGLKIIRQRTHLNFFNKFTDEILMRL